MDEGVLEGLLAFCIDGPDDICGLLFGIEIGNSGFAYTTHADEGRGFDEGGVGIGVVDGLDEMRALEEGAVFREFDLGMEVMGRGCFWEDDGVGDENDGGDACDKGGDIFREGIAGAVFGFVLVIDLGGVETFLELGLDGIEFSGVFLDDAVDFWVGEAGF